MKIIIVICVLFAMLFIYKKNGELKNKRYEQDCLDKCICPKCKSKLEKTTEFIPAHSEWCYYSSLLRGFISLE